MFLIVDCLLILAGRQPVILPAAIARSETHVQYPRRLWRWVTRLALVSFYASPLTNMVGAVCRVTFSRRRAEIVRLAECSRAAHARSKLRARAIQLSR